MTTEEEFSYRVFILAPNNQSYSRLANSIKDIDPQARPSWIDNPKVLVGQKDIRIYALKHWEDSMKIHEVAQIKSMAATKKLQLFTVTENKLLMLDTEAMQARLLRNKGGDVT